MWHSHVHHDFVKRIADGTLPIEKFKDYLVQDYLFLVCSLSPFDNSVLNLCICANQCHGKVQFARAKALSAYKSKSMEEIAGVRVPCPARSPYLRKTNHKSVRRRNSPHPA